MADKTTFKCELVEKNLIKAEIINKTILGAKLYQVDLISRKTYVDDLDDISSINPSTGDFLVYKGDAYYNTSFNSIINTYLIKDESPSLVSGNTYQTNNNFVSGTLNVFLNGLKLKEIEYTIESTNSFSISGIISEDDLRVNYIKKWN